MDVLTAELEKVKGIAERCVHYGMCKIDFLGTGVCPSGAEHKYVSYYPQGRMEIAYALAEGIIPVTERLVDIAKSCTLCEICDKQCYFLMELKPMRVMNALKDYVDAYLKKDEPIEKPDEDEVLQDLREVVGTEWATNDPAILVAYSRDCSSPQRMPKYIVMPESTQEVVGTIKIANRHGVPFIPRGAGSNIKGWALGEGVIIDFHRMKRIEVNPDNCTATVQPGVTAFELQKEAAKHGMLANTAEPAACVCANTIQPMYSTFSYSWGFGIETFVDAEIVTFDGEKVFWLNDRDAPNLFNWIRPPPGKLPPSPGIFTQLVVKLHQLTGDEEGIIVPFSNFDEALTMLREVSMRRIGLAVAIMSKEYWSMFASPTIKTLEELKHFLTKIGIEYLLMVVGDKYEIRAIKEMAEVTMDQDLISILGLGVNKFHETEGLELLSQAEFKEGHYKVLLKEEFRPLLEMILSPSVDNIAELVDEDLKDFFKQLYSRPEFTDIFWLNKFRIVSARMGRTHAFTAVVAFCSFDNKSIKELCEAMKASADKYNLTNYFGSLTSVDHGKMALIEWDYYYDHTNDQERENAMVAKMDFVSKGHDLAQKVKNLMPYAWLTFAATCRKETWPFYRSG